MNSEPEKNNCIKITTIAGLLNTKHVFRCAVLLALIAAISCGGGQVAENAAPPVNNPAPSAPAASTPNTARITLAKFNELKEGMSYKEAADIIGAEGRILSESGEPENKIEYRWEGSGRPGANADVTFQNDKLTDKVQFGLV